MRPGLLRLGGVLVAAGVLTAVALWQWPIGGDVASVLGDGDAERGAYLARISGCVACHSDFAGGGAPLAGGVRIESPFGTFVSPNVTTDPEHGIGAWSLTDFDRAVRQGVSPEGAPYYPAFPYAFYGSLSDQDIADMWAAFRTVPLVAQVASGHELGFPFNIRFGLKLWRTLYFEPVRFDPDPTRDPRWNWGAFIVNGPGHCGPATRRATSSALATRRAALRARAACRAAASPRPSPRRTSSGQAGTRATSRPPWSSASCRTATR